MLLVSLTLLAFGLVQTLPIDEAETPATSDVPDSGRVVFDQRQTGRFNIHVSIKDVAIIEVGQNGLAEETYNDEEDYYYDDSALTVKPIKLTTEASTTTSTTTSTTSVAAPPESTATTVSPVASSTASPSAVISTAGDANLNTSFSSNLLADIAASLSKPRSRLNNLMIVETPIGGTAKPLHHPHLHARSKDVPIMAAAATATAAITPPTLPESIEYTPPKGHNSPIFKVKVQRSSMPATKKPTRCRNHQVRDAQGKCSDSI
ncbi:cell wall integrity and stress response component 3 isoform X2 [Drosophila elegans]|nr:cell wall integrity and stress response component 3 isoform X2 [Drosophila elegans]